nr:hypothetical protein B0A51_14709 [Rachicladosporium sp. CCFEE 5018]
MITRASPSPWTCANCLRHQVRLARRSLVTSATSRGAAAAALKPEEDYAPIIRSAPSTSHDDRNLRQIFDSPSFWKDFSARTRHQHDGRSVGLFQNKYLTKPSGFQDFASVTLRKCQRIVDGVLKYSTVDEYKRIVRDLDRLSDLLCRVIDLSDFVRSVHPDREVQDAATQAYSMMFEYMNVLNTTPGLEMQLKKAASMPEVSRGWSEEERTVANILMKDFAKSAIHLPEAERQAFVDLSNEVAQVGTEFVDNMAPETPYLRMQGHKLKGMDPMVVRRLTKWGTSNVPTTGMPAALALRTVDDADTRKEIYMANRTSAQDNLHRLEQMLTRRADLAKLSGYESFAHMALEDKMAKTPEAVLSFLHALSQDNKPRVADEMRDLLDLKLADAHSSALPQTLEPWDRDYYTSRLVSTLRSRARTQDTLSAYFSLGTVMQGLSRLFHRLYNLRLVPHETLPGETWNPDVRRLDVIDDTEGHIAVIYCDLFGREGKSPNPAHFTLRCSRRVTAEEIAEAASLPSSSGFPDALSAANDGLATSFNGNDNNAPYQLPTIALICDFPSSPSSRPTLLSHRDLTTLFHEMGHALHSICGRTALQNVSGTRCATDFAELPSVLMESFASDPEVLALYARHWETDAPLDPGRVRERVEAERRCAGAEVEGQVCMGVLDQRLHSSWPPVPASSSTMASTQVYHDVWRQYSTLPEPHGTSWQGFFGHLYGYGATYYSYLFDRAIAGKVWSDVFQRSGRGALDPAAGAKFREEVLRWGGGRDGWRCVGGVLEDGVVREGGKHAMERVGGWGVHQ